MSVNMSQLSVQVPPPPIQVAVVPVQATPSPARLYEAPTYVIDSNEESRVNCYSSCKALTIRTTAAFASACFSIGEAQLTGRMDGTMGSLTLAGSLLLACGALGTAANSGREGQSMSDIVRLRRIGVGTGAAAVAAGILGITGGMISAPVLVAMGGITILNSACTSEGVERVTSTVSSCFTRCRRWTGL